MIGFLLSMPLVLAPINERADEVCPCDIPSEETQEAINSMIGAASSNTRISLVAPEIGIPKRILLVQMGVYINPEILWKSDETLLLPTSQIFALVPRAKAILVRAYDRNGNLSIQEFEGYIAYIFQHEIDRLDGISFLESMTNSEVNNGSDP